MFKRILIAYDGSEHAQRAAVIAGNMARMQKGTELWLLCVMEQVPSELGKPYIDDLIIERTQTGSDLIEKAKELIGKKVEVHEELLFGSPAESIMSVATNQKCDLIIMGTRGVGGLRALFIGSQIQKVISLSSIPVLAVK